MRDEQRRVSRLRFAELGRAAAKRGAYVPGSRHRCGRQRRDRRCGDILSHATATWTINDTKAPQTKITKRPKNKTSKKRAKHKFEANEVGATFECRYDRRKWKSCESPKKKKVDPGKHRFKVRAIDVGGNVDAKPAKDKWQFKRKCGSKKPGEARRSCRKQNKDKHF